MKKISILIVALLVAVAASAQPQGGPRGGDVLKELQQLQILFL